MFPRYRATVLPLSRRGFLGATGLGVVSALAVGDDVAAQTADDPPEYPVQPFLVTAHGAPYFRPGGSLGWKSTTAMERVRTIRGLHPNLLDFRRLLWVRGSSVPLPPGVQGQREFSLTEGLPGTAGQTPYIRIGDVQFPDRYDYLRNDRDWTFPDGSPVETRRDILAEDIHGEPHGYNVQAEGIGIASVFCPAILDILTAEAAGAFDAGFVAMFYDSVTTPRVQGLDASRWAHAAFREHLGTLPADRLDTLDVSDPGSFDIRQALEGANVLPGSDRHPATEPIYREYTLFHHQGVKSLVEAYHRWIADTYPARADQRQAFLYANHYVGDRLHGSVAASLYTTDPVDTITVEDDRTKPPDYQRAFVYKLFDAAGRGDKPVLFEGEMHDAPGPGDKLRGLDPSRTYPTLMRLQIGEAYAHGVPRKLSLTSWGNIHVDDIATHWIQPDGTVPNTLRSFADFLFVNRRFLAGAESGANIAVVYSMPTNVWETAPQWGRYDERQGDSFRGACRTLTDAHLPYDVRIFGHERLWNDDDQLAGLDRYDAVVLAGHTALADRHAEALEEVLRSGGIVVVSGDPPERDEYYRERDRPLFDRDRAIVLDGNPARRRVTEGRTANVLVEAVRSAATVTISPGASLGVSRLQQRGPERVLVHLVNYDWTEDTDEMNPVSGVSVSIVDVPFEVGAARFVSPQNETELEIEGSDDGISVTVPAVVEWGFIVFARSAADLAPDSDEGTVRATAEELRDRLSEARERLEAPSQNRPLVRAELLVEEVELAVDAGAFDLADDRAEVAQTGMDRLYGETGIAEKATPTKSGSTPSAGTESGATSSGGMPGFTLLSGLVAAVVVAVRAWIDSGASND